MPFPQDRPRRMRRTEALRRLVRETTLAPDDLVAVAAYVVTLRGKEIAGKPSEGQAVEPFR